MLKDPGASLDDFDRKIHPEWKDSFGVQQLVLPSGKTVAFWDYKHGPYFYKYGYFRNNPRIPTQFGFLWNPEFEPYPKLIPGNSSKIL